MYTVFFLKNLSCWKNDSVVGFKSGFAELGEYVSEANEFWKILIRVIRNFIYMYLYKIIGYSSMSKHFGSRERHQPYTLCAA